MLWLALILPQLPLQVFARGSAEPGLLTVTEAAPGRRICAASPQARALGVKRGQRLASALAVAPALQLRERNPELEEATLKEVADWAGAYTPQLSFCPPDGLLLEIGASLRLFGGESNLRTNLLTGLAALGLHAVAASAPTPLAARWLACAGHGSTPLPPDWRGLLDELPLAVLLDGSNVAGHNLELLAGIGARTLGDIRRLPRAGLARRDAAAVTHTLALAYGETPDLRPSYQPPPRFEHRLVMPSPTIAVEPLLFAARRLFTSLSGWLAARQAAADHCRLVLMHEHGEDTVVDIVTGAPSRDQDRLGLLARERLAALSLPEPVVELRLHADAPSPLAPRSDDLFGDPGTARENARLLVDRLRARLGEDSVRQLRPLAEHRPERAWATLPPADAPRAERGTAPLPAQQRPLWLLPQARRLQPRGLAADATPGEGFQLLSGPERIESGWWDEAGIRRDYHQALDPQGARCWLYRELDPPCDWYLHGYFA